MGKEMINKGVVGVLIIILIASLVFFLVNGGSNSFNRSFSSSTVGAGENFEVTYTVEVTDDVRYFFLEDQVPSSFEVIDCNHDNTNKLKFYSIRLNEGDAPIGEKVYTCTIKAPSTPGKYSFVSEYFYEGVSEAVASSDILEVVSS